MKIGIDIRIWGEGMGGIGRYTKELAQNILPQYLDSELWFFYNSRTLPNADLLFLQSHKNVKLVQVNIRHYSLKEQILFPFILNKYDLDLIHFPNFNVPLMYTRPFITTIHDTVHHKISGAKKSRFLHFWLYKKIIRNAAKKSRKIITVSETSKKEIVNLFRIPPEKIGVIYEGGGRQNFNATQAEILQIKNEFLIQKPYFLFVGVLERKKNLHNLTKGFDLFLNKYNYDFDLVIVGKPDVHYMEIKNQAMQISHPEKLIFTGQVSERRLRILYSQAFAFVSASLHEGFGLPGVEAMYFGLPLIVSNIEVFNEIYDDAAVYFNPVDPEDVAEKFHLLVKDDRFYERLSNQSQKRGRLYDWKKTAAQTLNVYKQAILE